MLLLVLLLLLSVRVAGCDVCVCACLWMGGLLHDGPCRRRGCLCLPVPPVCIWMDVDELNAYILYDCVYDCVCVDGRKDTRMRQAAGMHAFFTFFFSFLGRSSNLCVCVSFTSPSQSPT